MIVKFKPRTFFVLSFDICRSFQVLNLNGNELKELPLSFVGLSALNVLCVESNQLSCLPTSFAFPKLSEFSARDNKLTKLPASLEECTDLEVLDLGDNPIEQDLAALATRLPKLRMLSL